MRRRLHPLVLPGRAGLEDVEELELDRRGGQPALGEAQRREGGVRAPEERLAADDRRAQLARIERPPREIEQPGLVGGDIRIEGGGVAQRAELLTRGLEAPLDHADPDQRRRPPTCRASIASTRPAAWRAPRPDRGPEKLGEGKRCQRLGELGAGAERDVRRQRRLGFQPGAFHLAFEDEDVGERGVRCRLVAGARVELQGGLEVGDRGAAGGEIETARRGDAFAELRRRRGAHRCRCRARPQLSPPRPRRAAMADRSPRAP